MMCKLLVLLAGWLLFFIYLFIYVSIYEYNP